MCGIYFFFLDHFPAVSFFSHNFLATTHNMHTSCVHCVFFSPTFVIQYLQQTHTVPQITFGNKKLQELIVEDIGK